MQTEPEHPLYVSRLSLIAALAACALFLVFVMFLHRPQQPPSIDLSSVPPEDVWKYTDGGRAAKLAEVTAREQSLASSYGWVDRDKGVVRLPVDRAVEQTIKEINLDPQTERPRKTQ
ncbi:MAG: hypothetical protein WC378_19545 [Opitutaceae bacterium]|jgi:hypothetical protein